MKSTYHILLLLMILSMNINSSGQSLTIRSQTIRQPVDTVGFAHLDWQMDSIMARIMRLGFSDKDGIRDGICATSSRLIRTVICPHDDYSYVGQMYPVMLSCMNAKTVLLFGVAHKAKQFGLEDVLVFDRYDYWQAPYGPVKVSKIREGIMEELPEGYYTVNNPMHTVEHSLEALIPFLQYFNKAVEIVPILVPYMSYGRIDTIARDLARAIDAVNRKQGWRWGGDIGIVISTDAVHYGDEDWGGSNYAFYGSDSAGYHQAVDHEWEIIDTLSGELNPDNVRKFMNYTVQEEDYKVYKWTWCGRYSVPMGLMTSYYLASLENGPLTGIPVGYSTSIDHGHIKVDDLRMGVTAPANLRHWVGYAGIIYQ